MTPEPPGPRARSLAPTALAMAALLATAGALLLAGAALADSPAPAASSAPATSSGPAASGSTAISIVGQSFQPSQLTIQVGQTVTWTVTQSIGAAHSVTSGHPNDTKPGTVFDSGIRLENDGDSFSYTFTAPGTYPFFCAVHPTTMTGTVTVLSSGTTGGSEGTGADPTTRLLAVGILIAAFVVLFGWARLYRRMNPAP